MSRLNFLEKAQWWDKEQILDFQKKSINKLANIAYYETSFYRTLFDNVQVLPREISNPKDLQQLPIVSKDMLRQNYPNLVTRSTGQKTYEASTSGSTGKNFIVREDAFTAGWYRATFMLELEWAGWVIGEPHLQTGMTLKRSSDRRMKDWVLNCHYVSAYQLDDDHLDEILLKIERNHLQYLWGYPGSLYYLAKHAKKRGWNQPLKSAVTWGDMLYPHYRKEIEEAFQTKLFDTYGCAEGFHIAAQCGFENHYHIQDLDVIVEFLDENNQPVPSGTPGRVVVTRLHPGPMPLLRYQIGDIATPLEGECKCGREFSLLQSIQGRDTDIVLTPGGNRLIVHFFTGILEHFPEIDTFQIIQEDINSIQLLIVPRRNFSSDISNKIIRELKIKGTDDLKINIQLVQEIPLNSTGKRRFVISKLTNNNKG